MAENLPATITLQRSGFSDGRKLTLAGEVAAAETQKLIDFYDTLRKAQNKKTGQPFFNPTPENGDQLSYRQQGDKVVWNFSLELEQTQEEGKEP